MERFGQTITAIAAIAVSLVVAQHVLYPVDPSSTPRARAALLNALDRVQTTGSTAPSVKR